MELNSANILTLLRIVLIPVLVLVFFLPYAWSNEVATAVFGLAALTDWLDGYVARRFDQTTRFGAFLDPVADKLMVAVVLVLLLQAHPTAWFAIPAAIIIGREISISALREWMAAIGQRAAVDVQFIGKIKTTCQMVSLLLLLYADPLFRLPTFRIGHALLWVAAVLTMWSMVVYLRAAWPAITHPMEKPPES